jgi:hypothetical protein
MTASELNKMLFEAYMLGQRVLFETGNVKAVSVKDDKSWDILYGIADGTTTIVSDPEEMLQGMPAAPGRIDAMREYLKRVAPLRVQRDKDLAQRIVAGANDAL